MATTPSPPTTAGIGGSSYIPLVPNGLGASINPFIQAGITTFTCNGVTPVTVVYAPLTANSIIIPTLKTAGGTVGALPVVQTVTPGTGFTIQGTASDTSVYNLLILG